MVKYKQSNFDKYLSKLKDNKSFEHSNYAQLIKAIGKGTYSKPLPLIVVKENNAISLPVSDTFIISEIEAKKIPANAKVILEHLPVYDNEIKRVKTSNKSLANRSRLSKSNLGYRQAGGAMPKHLAIALENKPFEKVFDKGFSLVEDISKSDTETVFCPYHKKDEPLHIQRQPMTINFDVTAIDSFTFQGEVNTRKTINDIKLNCRLDNLKPLEIVKRKQNALRISNSIFNSNLVEFLLGQYRDSLSDAARIESESFCCAEFEAQYNTALDIENNDKYVSRQKQSLTRVWSKDKLERRNTYYKANKTLKGFSTDTQKAIVVSKAKSELMKHLNYLQSELIRATKNTKRQAIRFQIKQTKEALAIS